MLGSLPEDSVVRKSVNEQIPFTILYPDAPISQAIKRMVEQFIHHQTEEIHVPMKSNKFLSRLKSIFSKGRD